MAVRPRVSTQILVHIVDQLQARGRDPAGLLSACSIDPAGLTDIEQMTPLEDYVRFFERAAEAIGDPHFGLHAAKAGDDGALGALSFLFMSAPTLSQAFDGFVQFLSVMQEGTLMELRPHQDDVHFVYQLRDDRIAQRRQDSEYSIAATMQLIKQYTFGKFSPREIYFEHEQIGRYQIYVDYFSCDVFFGQAVNSIVFDRKILDTRSPRLSTRLYPIVAAHLQSAMNQREAATHYSAQVRRSLTEERLSRPLHIQDIAAELGLSGPGLARRLAQEGVLFRDLVMSRRMSLAERLLSDSRLPVSEIAIRLGYAENASFKRAFRGQFGQTPNQFRKAGRRGLGSAEES